MPTGYPILLDVGDKAIVIVGGGRVAMRKAAGLQAAGAGEIVVVSPAFAEGFGQSVRKVAEVYRAEHLRGADLVFAATDSAQVNAEVVRDARALNLWVNRADADESPAGDFSTPAQLHEGLFTISVSCDNPALSAFVRDRLRHAWDPRWTLMAEAMRRLRPMILSSGLPIAHRREIFRELASEEAMDLLFVSGVEALWAWARAKYPLSES